MHELLAAGMFACLHRVSDKGSRLQRNRWFKQGSQTTLAEFQVSPSAFPWLFLFPCSNPPRGSCTHFLASFNHMTVLLPCWVLEITFLVLVWGSSLLSHFFRFFRPRLLPLRMLSLSLWTYLVCQHSLRCEEKGPVSSARIPTLLCSRKYLHIPPSGYPRTRASLFRKRKRTSLVSASLWPSLVAAS